MPLTDLDLIAQRFDNFTSVVPAGWRDAGEGAFAYADTDIAIVQRHIPAPAIRFVQPGIVNDLNLRNAQTLDMEHEANGLRWQLYSGETDQFRVAYALAKGRGFLSVYMVLMQVPPADYDHLFQTLFLPTLDALQPR